MSKLESATKAIKELKVEKVSNIPTDKGIRNLYNKFLTTGSVLDLPRNGRPTKITDDDKINKVKDALAANPNLSLRELALLAGVSKTSMSRMMHRFPGQVKPRSMLAAPKEKLVVKRSSKLQNKSNSVKKTDSVKRVPAAGTLVVHSPEKSVTSSSLNHIVQSSVLHSQLSSNNHSSIHVLSNSIPANNYQVESSGCSIEHGQYFQHAADYEANARPNSQQQNQAIFTSAPNPNIINQLDDSDWATISYFSS
jgi:hypothetical protein